MTNPPQPAETLVVGYHLELSEILCLPGSDAKEAKATLDSNIAPVLPYLNAEWKGADYQQGIETLIWKTGGRKYALRPREIAVASVQNHQEAVRLVEDMIARVNDVWNRRNQIKPNCERRQVPTVMDIYKLLPRTNCRQCGQPTCLAYAARLREQKAALSQCPPLSAESSAAVRQQLAHLVGQPDSRTGE